MTINVVNPVHPGVPPIVVISPEVVRDGVVVVGEVVVGVVVVVVVVGVVVVVVEMVFLIADGASEVSSAVNPWEHCDTTLIR